MTPNNVAPVALPGLETTPKSGPAGGPDVAPVFPLSIGGGEPSDLLGAGDHQKQTTSDPTATKVLVRGEILAAPAGRADEPTTFRGRAPALSRALNPILRPNRPH